MTGDKGEFASFLLEHQLIHVNVNMNIDHVKVSKTIQAQPFHVKSFSLVFFFFFFLKITY